MSEYETDETLFLEMPDHTACVLLWNDIDGPRWRIVMNPGATSAQREAFDGWLAEMQQHVSKLGMARAVEVDDWQLRSDGMYQKWVRSVRIEDPFA